MYIPTHFEINDKNKILAFIRRNAFGQITSIVQQKLFASHAPFLINEDSTVLLGHLAKANPQWRSIEDQEVLVTFQGAHGYISPSWYKSPGVPTWNYQAVHIYGRCKVSQDPDHLKETIDTLTKTYESKSQAPWVIEYDTSKLHGIVGLKIDITKIECKYKLSQNRSEVDRIEVITQLEANGSIELAAAMGDDDF
jgi:transcriptional regulator